MIVLQLYLFRFIYDIEFTDTSRRTLEKITSTLLGT